MWRDMTPSQRIAIITARQRRRRALGLGDRGGLLAEERLASEQRLERIRARIQEWERQYEK